uniref:Uncharacterized protein n=1 Tax=Candidatus Kentrum sp. FW TaxID=2126338 RepID=A0A450U2J2_9GAMM|nr:MAG: hypothetical protein BECKFW1821C_GA0114237_111911 [Candidatus Kentron sp. FW]
MVSIRLVEALGFSRDRRVVLGIFGFSRIFAEYNSAIPDCPRRIGRELDSPASKVRGAASLGVGMILIFLYIAAIPPHYATFLKLIG